MDASLARATHALLRIAGGTLFLQHGLQKLFGLLGGVDGLGATVPVLSLPGVAGALEVVGGALLIVGLTTRPIAAVFALEMLAVFILSRAPRSGWLLEGQAELALIYVALFAFLACNGPGTFSIDTLVQSTWRLERRRPARDRRQPLPEPWVPHAVLRPNLADLRPNLRDLRPNLAEPSASTL